MDRTNINGDVPYLLTPFEEVPAAQVTTDYPAGTIIVPVGVTARFSVFPICLTGLSAPFGTTAEWGLGINVASNLNQAISRAKGDWVFIMGDDHLFASDVLLRLLAHQVPIVSPICLRRMPPYTPLVYRDQLPDGRGTQWDPETLPTTGLHSVYWASMSGVLIQRSVLDAIPYPWFEVGQMVSDELSEDVYFAKKCRDRGIPWHVDCDTVIGHITPTCLWPVVQEGRWAMTLDPTCSIPAPGPQDEVIEVS